MSNISAIRGYLKVRIHVVIDKLADADLANTGVCKGNSNDFLIALDLQLDSQHNRTRRQIHIAQQIFNILEIPYKQVSLPQAKKGESGLHTRRSLLRQLPVLVIPRLGGGPNFETHTPRQEGIA